MSAVIPALSRGFSKSRSKTVSPHGGNALFRRLQVPRNRLDECGWVGLVRLSRLGLGIGHPVRSLRDLARGRDEAVRSSGRRRTNDRPWILIATAGPGVGARLCAGGLRCWAGRSRGGNTNHQGRVVCEGSEEFGPDHVRTGLQPLAVVGGRVGRLDVGAGWGE